MLSLIATLVLGATQMSAAPGLDANPSLAALAPEPTSVVVDCAVGAEFLTDCRVVNDEVEGSVGAQALQLAEHIPAKTAEAGAIDGRIKVRLKLNR